MPALTTAPATPFSEVRNLSDCYLGDINDQTGIIYDARSFARASAISAFAREYGVDFKDVRCRTMFGRWLDIQEQWEIQGQDEWLDCYEGEDEDPEAPDLAPEDYEPDEDTPAWTFAEANEAGAVKIYVCEVRG